MKKFLFSLILLFGLSIPAFSQDYLYFGMENEHVRISKEPCKSDLIKSLTKPEFARQLRTAEYVTPKGNIPGCYVPRNELVEVLFEDGDTFAIPQIEFRKSPVEAQKRYEELVNDRAGRPTI